MPDDNQQNDRLQNTALEYEGLDPAVFEEGPDLTPDQLADELIADSLGGDEGYYGDEQYGDEGYDDPAETALGAVAQVDEDVVRYQDSLRELQDELPHILSPAALRELEPRLVRVAEQFGWAEATKPELIASLYERIGGENRFAGEHEAASFADSVVNAKQRTGSPFEA